MNNSGMRIKNKQQVRIINQFIKCFSFQIVVQIAKKIYFTFLDKNKERLLVQFRQM